MNKNGKDIYCKVCKSKFYVSRSRLMIKKYCSRECAKKDNYGFIARRKNCIICKKEFLITQQIRVGKKTCSDECWRANNYEISKRRCAEKTEKTCKICGNKFTGLKHVYGTGICNPCIFKRMSSGRAGKNNPNYKDGIASHNKYGRHMGIYTARHFRACAKYRKAFLEKNEYLYCENCGVNANLAKRFEVHHIYFASLFPRHINLHNFRNLILVCKQCHIDFHSGNKIRDKFLHLEKERRLKELFSKSLVKKYESKIYK